MVTQSATLIMDACHIPTFPIGYQSSLISMTFSKKRHRSDGALSVAITGSSDTGYLPVEGESSQADVLALKGAIGDSSDTWQLADALDHKEEPSHSDTGEDSNRYSTESDKASAITIVWVGAMMYPPRPKIGPSKAKADTSSEFSYESARGTMSSYTERSRSSLQSLGNR